MQNRRLSSRFLLCLVAMALFAGIGIELAPYIAFADLLPPMADDEEEVTWIDGAGVSRTDTINKWTSMAIARNLVIEDQIEVCTSDYPIALNEAVGDLNGDLGNVFAVGACQPDLTNDYIDFVEIDGRLPSADDFFCGGSPFACILLPPRTLYPLYSFSGEVLVIVNADRRDPADDDNGSSDDDYRAVRRTIAHELGHAIGFGDHSCRRPATAVEVQTWQWNHDSLMMCSGRSTAYPLQNRDLADFQGLYTPNAVSDDPGDPPLAVPGVDPGSVVFAFDASRVRVERDLRIYRWHEDAATPGNSRWVHVETFLPSSGRVTWTARNQPGGNRVYRIFSTTPVITAGQCYIDDRDCTVAAGRPNVDRIGVPTGDATV